MSLSLFAQVLNEILIERQKYVVIINIQPWPFSDYLKLPANLKGIQNTNGTVTLYSIAPYWKPCHSAPHSVQYIFLQFP